MRSFVTYYMFRPFWPSSRRLTTTENTQGKLYQGGGQFDKTNVWIALQ